MRGLAASLITFMQMLVLSTMSGVVAPLAFGSASGLAIVVLASFLLAATCWTISRRGSAPVET